MRVRWTAEAQSDLVRLFEFLAPVNRQAAARAVQSLRAAPARLLRTIPASGHAWTTSQSARFDASGNCARTADPVPRNNVHDLSDLTGNL
jgi:plasmid stabilization system protein ParE